MVECAGERVDCGGGGVEAEARARGEGARESSGVEEAERMRRWDMVDFQPPPGEALGLAVGAGAWRVVEVSGLGGVRLMAADKDPCSFAGGVAKGSSGASGVSGISGADGAGSVRGTSENLSVRSAVEGGAGSAGGDLGVDLRGIVPGAPFSNMAALALTFDGAILAWGEESLLK